MLPTGKEISARTNIVFEEMLRWAREEFQLPEFRVTRKLTARSDRSWSKGGLVPHIQIGVQSLMTKPVIAFMEYKSFNNYLEVGGFKTTDWTLWLDCLIAHEMSHAIHSVLKYNPHASAKLGRFDTQPHGNTFLHIYKRVRQRFVNERVPREAYTAPRHCWTIDETTTRFDPASKPLQGHPITINRKNLTVLGRDMDSRRDYCWKAEDTAGNVYNIKLVDICHTASAREIVLANPSLKFLYQHAEVKHINRAASRGRRRYY